jgi:hypothetical protein
LSSSARRLAELRKHLRPYWAASEGGGIFLLAALHRQEHERFFEALAARVPQLAQIVPEKQPAQLARILADDVLAFLEAGKLAPGPYQLNNYHLDYAENGNLTSNGDGDPPIARPSGYSPSG